MSVPDGLTADRVLNAIADGKRAHDARVPVYDHAYDVYRATRPAQTNKQTWESTMRVPYGLQTIDTTLVNIVGDVPRADIRPRRPSDAASAPIMQRLLDYHVDADHLDESWPLFVWQGLVYPITVAKVHWLYKETERVGRDFMPNPADPQQPIPLERPERLVLRDGPTFEPWSIYDAWWDPNARDVDTASYFVLRSWESVEDIQRKTKTESQPFGQYDPDAAAELLKMSPRGAGNQLSSLERDKRGTDDKRKNRYEILEVWRDDMLIVIAEQSVILRARANPYWHGRKPIVAAQTRIDGFELMGVGETELLDDLQQTLWSVEQAVMDNLHMTVHRGFTYRETGVLDPNKLVVKPRFMWPVTDHDDIRPVDMQQIGGDVYRQMDTLLQRMQLVTGINPFVSGVESVGVDQTTATGVTALTDLASRLLRFKARMLATKGLQRTFEMWGDLIQQFMDRETAIRIEGPGEEIDWQSVSPQDIVGSYDYAVRGVEESLSRQQQRGEVIALLNALAPFAQLGIINWPPLLRKVAEAYDFPTPNALINPQQLGPQQQAAPAGQPPPQNGGPPQIPPQQPTTLQGVPYQPQVGGAVLAGQ